MRGARTGQSVLEYAVFISGFCLVVVAGQLYLKRAMQGNLKAQVDSLSQTQFSRSTSDYDYGVVNSDQTLTTVNPQGQTMSTTTEDGVTTRFGYVDEFSGTPVKDEPLFPSQQ